MCVSMAIIVIPFNAAPYELYTTSCQVLTHPHYGHFVMYSGTNVVLFSGLKWLQRTQ